MESIFGNVLATGMILLWNLFLFQIFIFIRCYRNMREVLPPFYWTPIYTKLHIFVQSSIVVVLGLVGILAYADAQNVLFFIIFILLSVPNILVSANIFPVSNIKKILPSTRGTIQISYHRKSRWNQYQNALLFGALNLLVIPLALIALLS